MTEIETTAINDSTNILNNTEGPLSWNYFEAGELKRKYMKICITCNHFRFSTIDTYVTIHTCQIQRKLIPHGDHLFRGYKNWK